jgi:hypothetical protein
MKKTGGDGSKSDGPTDEAIKVESVQKERMVGHGSKFGRRKEAAIAALLSCRTLEEAARTAGIGATTLLRWMKNPQFQAEYRAALNAAVSQANARIQQSSGAAAATIVKIMLNHDAKDSIRLRAAELVMSHSKDAQIEDVVARVRDLERAQSDKDNRDDLTPNSEPGARAEIRGQTSAEKMVVRLNKARERMNQEDELARQTAAAAAAMEKSEVTEP